MDGERGELRGFFLDRLERMSRLASVNLDAYAGRWAENVPEEEVREQLLRRAVFSTYLDCLEQGAEAEARTILNGTRAGQASPVGS